jgi:guanylate kinase
MQVAKEELELMHLYDYVVENDSIEAACEKINCIIVAEHCRRERVEVRYKKMLEVK